MDNNNKQDNSNNIRNMSKDIKTLLDTEIYPQLYQSLEHALPEFGFKKRGRAYISSTGHKITGDEGKKGKVYVYQNNPSHLIDFTRGNQSLWDYIQERDSLTNQETLQKLAELSGVALPKMETPELLERIKEQNRASQIWENLNSYFVYLLTQDEGAPVMKYLQDRGYSPEDVKEMGLGYIPTRERIFKYMTGTLNYSEDELQKVVKLSSRIGDSHTLSIPFRDPVGRIRGLIVRATKPGIEPKYLYSTGLKKGELLLNLQAVRGDRDLILVEGQLDALIAGARGVENIASIGGADITEGQIELCKKYGAQKITLFMDNDKAGREATLRNIDKLQKHFRVYAVFYPPEMEPGIDPDQIIKEKGVEAFKELTDKAYEGFRYRLQATWTKYQEIADSRGGELFPKQKDELLEEVVSWGQIIEEPLDRAQYTKLFLSFTPVKSMGITEEALSSTVDKIRYNQEKEKQKIKLSKLLSDAKGYQDGGEVDKALELLDENLRDVKLQRGKDLLPPSPSFEDTLQEIADTPPALQTGYPSLDKFIGIPQGAITLVAGRPSHGKTTFMFNLLLEMSKLYQGKKFYFFTYEEPRRNIIVKLLNRLTDESLKDHYGDYPGIRPTNFELLKAYIRNQDENIQDIQRGKKALRELLDRVEIVDKNYSVEELYSLISYLNKKEDVGAIFIDYIQRMRTEKRTQDKRTEIAHISNTVLQIAKDTGLPIILGAQMNRQAKQQTRPTLDNLKEAGNLEEDANTVLSVFNEARESQQIEGDGMGKPSREILLEIKALKNREGEVNRHTELLFDTWTGTIKNSTNSF